MLPPPKKPLAIDDEIVERWHLNLPPEGVVVLLQATCIDRTHESQAGSVVWNTLWGPKSWSIRFKGLDFQLEPLHRRRREFTGEPSYYWLGSITPAKHGSVVELRVRDGSALLAVPRGDRRVVATLIGGAAIVSVPFASQWGIGAMIGVPLFIVAWGTFASLWMGTRQASAESRNFLDQVFGRYCVSEVK